MKDATMIGMDLAKNIFQLYGVDHHGKPCLNKAMHRSSVIKFFANLPASTIGMEACAGSAYWARTIQSLGHEVRRIHPRYVTPYRIGNKNDRNDAAAICEAMQRPNMKSVPLKTQEQDDIQAVHRVRQGLVRARTACLNQIRGMLAESGIVFKQGACHVRTHVLIILDDEENGLSSVLRQLLRSQLEYLDNLDTQILKLNIVIKNFVTAHRDCENLMNIPGVGIMTASILFSAIGVRGQFKNGREFAAFLGLVPRQHSSGGKPRYLGISKRGDAYTRTLLIHCARAALRSHARGGALFGTGHLRQWIGDLVERRGVNKACVALANKIARIAWSMLSHKVEFQLAA